MDEATNSQPVEQADILRTQLTILDHEIENLIRKRAEIRRRFNQLRSPMSLLTSETLSMIFEYACDLPTTADIDDAYQPVILGSVSNHWRKVTHITPSIWNRLCIHLRGPNHTSSNTLSLLQLYFKRSANQTLSLRLDLPEEYYCDKTPGSDLSIEDVEHTTETEDPQSIVPISTIFQLIIKEHPTKLQSLFINEFSLEYLSLLFKYIESPTGLPNLERIHIAWYQGAPVGYDWNDSLIPLPAALVPRLTNVSLGQSSPGFQIPYGQLTDISLENIPIDRCLEIIVLCPMASECHIFEPLPPTDPTKMVPSTPVILSNTTCLGWAFGFQKWDVAFLKLFTFPALKRFRCENQSSDGIQSDDDIANEDRDIHKLQKRFFSRCPQLTVYERNASDVTNWTFLHLYRDLPDTIEALYLRHVEVEEASRVSAKLWRGIDFDYTMRIFPQLRVLGLEGNFCWNMSTFFPSLITMLEARRCVLAGQYKDHARLEELRLQCEPESTKFPHPLTEEQRAQLQNFVNKGLMVITSDSGGNDLSWSPEHTTLSQ